ncbi:MAG: tRNA (N6-isopentenyl adenosine(37)-C2)-methylthiotransferase MiaB [Deltaproteobacteria bacterium]
MSESTYYIETYGCQMNEHDSEKMSAMLEDMGLTRALSPNEAEVVVINTCAIREKAEHKVYSALGKLKASKKKKPDMVIIAAGCVAEQGRGALLRKVGHLDAVLGTHRISQLTSVIERVRKTRQPVDATGFAEDVASLHLPAPCRGPSPACSYVTVMQGCSNFCSYCVVPYTRGPEQSRPAGEILHEVRAITERGVKEITLLGQNVNAYGKDLGDGTAFPALLEDLNGIPALSRVRFTTSHPRDFGPEIAAAMGMLDSVCEHIHLPLQSGSDRILHAMRRGYGRDDYLRKIAILRDTVPRVAITADIIVGFPGETTEDFEQTVSALEEIRFDQIFSFKFSPRPGTSACHLPDQVPDEIKVARLAKVHAVQDRITEQYHRNAEGTEEEILIEGVRERSGQPFGRTRTNKMVNLDSADAVRQGDLVRVEIIRGLKHSLLGKKRG